MKQIKHTLALSPGGTAAYCSCKHWLRSQNDSGVETRGQFANRAYTEHAEHVLTRQGDLFPALTGLFVDGEVCQ